MNEIKEASKDDEEMNMLMQMIITGWPEHKDNVPLQIRHHFTYRDELTAQDGIVLRGQRLVVPKSLRSTMKAKCHAGHLGINSTLRRARDLLYWPGMSTDVRNYVEACGNNHQNLSYLEMYHKDHGNELVQICHLKAEHISSLQTVIPHSSKLIS